MAFSTSNLLGANLGSTSTTPYVPVGTIVDGDGGSRWMYVKAAGTISQYDYVTIDEDFSASAGTKAAVDDGHSIGFAQVAAVADDYLWVALQGRGGLSVNVLGSCAADVALYTTADAGKLDDSSTSQSLITGITLATANGTSVTAACEFIATFPRGPL